MWHDVLVAQMRTRLPEIGALLVLSACGGKIASYSSVVPMDASTFSCSGQGLALGDVYVTGAPSASTYTYGQSPATCDGTSAERLTWIDPTPNATLVIEALEDARSLAGREAVVTVHLRGDAVGQAIVFVNTFDGREAPVGFATTQDKTNIAGSFDWTAYELTFPVAPSASKVSIGVGLIGSGTLDVASVTLTPGD